MHLGPQLWGIAGGCLTILVGQGYALDRSLRLGPRTKPRDHAATIHLQHNAYGFHVRAYTMSAYLYHVTPLPLVKLVSIEGLLPRRGGTLDTGTEGRVCLTIWEGVGHWYMKLCDREGAPVPVVLRAKESDLEELWEDAPGKETSGALCWESQEPIDPEFLEVWNGDAWLPIEEWPTLDRSRTYPQAP